jgi:hypothetical protein
MVNRMLLGNARYPLFLVLICLSVLLHMLGAPIIFWDLDGSEDDFISTLLMGVLSTVSYMFRDEHSFFRPPVFS